MKTEPVGTRTQTLEVPECRLTGGPYLKPLAFVVLSAGLAVFWAGATHTPGEQQFEDFVSGGVAIGAAIGIVAVLAGWFDLTSNREAIATRTYYIIGAAMALGIGLFIRYYGMHQIGGWEDSVMLDFGWRMYNGQIANKDFLPCAFPIGWILGQKFAFQLFGIHRSSLTDITVLFALVTFVWAFFILTQLFGRQWWTLLLALTIQAPTTVMLAFWWYNPITIVASLLYVLAAALWLRRPASWTVAISYALSMVLLAAMKPNAGGILIPVVTIVLFCSPPHRWKTVILSAASFLIFDLILFVNKVNLLELIKGYLSVANRGADLKHVMLFLDPSEKYSIYAIGGVVIIPMFVIFYQYRKRLFSRRTAIPLSILFTAWWGFVINSDQYMDATFALFGIILLLGEVHEPKPSSFGESAFSLPLGWNRYTAWVCILFSASGITQGICREHVKTDGYPLFFEYDGDRYTINEGFYKGIHCGPIFNELLKEVDAVLEKAQGSNVWFGPRMGWGYAAYNKPSPDNQPVYWEPGLAFTLADEKMYFDRFIASHYDVLICFKNDFTFYSPEEKEEILEHYDMDNSPQVLTILRLKK